MGARVLGQAARSLSWAVGTEPLSKIPPWRLRLASSGAGAGAFSDAGLAALSLALPATSGDAGGRLGGGGRGRGVHAGAERDGGVGGGGLAVVAWFHDSGRLVGADGAPPGGGPHTPTWPSVPACSCQGTPPQLLELSSLPLCRSSPPRTWLTSAPSRIKVFTAILLPEPTHRYSGVTPRKLRALTSLPDVTSSTMTSTNPEDEAACRGVSPR